MDRDRGRLADNRYDNNYCVLLCPSSETTPIVSKAMISVLYF